MMNHSNKKIRLKNNNKKSRHHWYRRILHSLGAFLIFYYLIPDAEIYEPLKLWGPIGVMILIILFDLLRLNKKIHFPKSEIFRHYEHKRLGSYVYFGFGVLLLFLFFPEHIAVPCILCASISDPLMGELRYYFGKNTGFLGGFMLSFLFFFIFLSITSFSVLVFTALVGAAMVVFSEHIAGFWLDDDLLIQIIPAIIIFRLLTVI